jgi:hypothetical protein
MGLVAVGIVSLQRGPDVEVAKVDIAVWVVTKSHHYVSEQTSTLGVNLSDKPDQV